MCPTIFESKIKYLVILRYLWIKLIMDPSDLAQTAKKQIDQ